MLLNFLLFMALGVFTNTLLPFPFEPVLLHFAAGSQSPGQVLLALGGSAGAGLAGAVELQLLRRLGPRLPRALATGRKFFPGRSFYTWTFLMAFLRFRFPWCASRRSGKNRVPWATLSPRRSGGFRVTRYWSDFRPIPGSRRG